MSFNISSSIMQHLANINADVDFSTMSTKSVAMVKTYVRTGVMKTSGVTGNIAKYIRASNGLQYVHLRGNSMFCKNIHDKEVYNAIAAAITMCRIDNGKDNRVHIRYEGGRWVNGGVEELLRTCPDEFSVWTDGLACHFHLKKLSDTMEINTDEPLTVDLKKFIKD